MKYLRMLIISLLLLTLTGCGVTERNYHRVTIIVKSISNNFWKSVHNGAMQAASINNVDLTLLSFESPSDYQDQIDILRGSIAEKPDAIILASIDYDQQAKPAEEAIEAKIPLILVEQADMMVIGYLDVALVQNSYQMGYSSVETAVKHLTGKHVDKIIETGVYVVDKDNMIEDEI